MNVGRAAAILGAGLLVATVRLWSTTQNTSSSWPHFFRPNEPVQFAAVEVAVATLLACAYMWAIWRGGSTSAVVLLAHGLAMAAASSPLWVREQRSEGVVAALISRWWQPREKQAGPLQASVPLAAALMVAAAVVVLVCTSAVRRSNALLDRLPMAICARGPRAVSNQLPVLSRTRNLAAALPTTSSGGGSSGGSDRTPFVFWLERSRVRVLHLGAHPSSGGAAVVFVPHFGWQAPQLTALAASALQHASIARGFQRALIVEQPASGPSPLSAGDMSLDDALATAIQEGMVVSGVRAAILVAPCSAAPAASMLAAQCPDIVAGLVLIDPPVRVPASATAGAHCALLRGYARVAPWPCISQCAYRAALRSPTWQRSGTWMMASQTDACAAHALRAWGCCSTVVGCSCAKPTPQHAGHASGVPLPPPAIAAEWVSNDVTAAYTAIPRRVPTIAVFSSEAFQHQQRVFGGLVPHALVHTVPAPHVDGERCHFAEVLNLGAVVEAVAHVMQLVEDGAVVRFLTAK